MSDLSISKSVGRAFEVLEYFRGARAPCSTPDLRKALRYPYSSIRAILKSLAELGYLKYDREQKTYFPTEKLMCLGNWMQNALLESDELMKLLDRVFARVAETTALAAPNFIFNNLFKVHNGNQAMALRLRDGIAVTLTNSVSGRVLLAQMSDAEVQRVITHTRYWVDITKAPIIPQAGEIERAITRVRDAGHLVDYNVYKNGIGTVAYPVPSPFPNAPIAIFVSGPASRIRCNETKIRRIVELCLSAYRVERLS